MYSESDKAEAFVLYARGHSFRSIAYLLKTRLGCSYLSHTTVKKWAETPDSSGLTWEDKKSELDAIATTQVKDQIVREKVDIMKEGNHILGDVIDKLKEGKLEFKTADQAIYSMKALAELMEKIGDKRKRVAVEEQVRCLIDAMHEVPAVKAVLEDHWTEVFSLFQQKVLTLAESKRHE